MNNNRQLFEGFYLRKRIMTNLILNIQNKRENQKHKSIENRGKYPRFFAKNIVISCTVKNLGHFNGKK